MNCEDYLRQKDFVLWNRFDNRCRELIVRRCKTVADFKLWVEDVHKGREDG